MYNNVSEYFKTAIKSNAITTNAKLTFEDYFGEGQDLVLQGENLSTDALKIKDYCYNNGQLIGTAMAKELEVEIINDNYNLDGKEFNLEVGVLLSTQEFEYIPYGKYMVTEYSDLKSSNRYKLIANDFMIKLNPSFSENTHFNPTFPISLKNFYIDFMSSYGINVETQTLPNEDFMINEMPNFDGYTGRTILMKIAELFGSFAKMNRQGNCQMYLKTITAEQIDRNCMNSNLEINQMYGPVNVVSIGMSNITGENVTLRDNESIATYGEITIKIDDNPFTYTEELKELVIQDLYDRLHNLSYIPTKFKAKALLYTDCGDAIQVQNMDTDTYVDTIILNQDIVLPKTRQSSFSNLALTNTAQKNQYVSKSKQAQSQTEIIVDKQNQLIQSIISVTNSLDDNINILSSDMQKQLEDLGIALTEYQATISTRFEQTSADYTMLFNTLVERIDATSGDSNEQLIELKKYIHFVDGNIVLGQSNNELTLTIENDRISYKQNGTEVAYFSNNKLYVNELEVITKFYLGNFAFIPRANGNLSFKKVRG